MISKEPIIDVENIGGVDEIGEGMNTFLLAGHSQLS